MKSEWTHRIVVMSLLLGVGTALGEGNPPAAPGAAEEKVRTDVLRASKGIGEVFAEAHGFDAEDHDVARQATLMTLYGKLMGHMAVLEKHEGHLKGVLATDSLEAILDGLMPGETRLSPAQRERFRYAYQGQEAMLEQAGIPLQELSGMVFVNPQKAGQGRDPRLTPAQRRILGDAQLALTRELRHLLSEDQQACAREAKVHLGWEAPGGNAGAPQAIKKPKLPKKAAPVAPAMSEEEVRKEVMQAAKGLGELFLMAVTKGKGGDVEGGDEAAEGKYYGFLAVFIKHHAHLKGELAVDALEAELDGLMPLETRLTPAQRKRLKQAHQDQEALLKQAGIPLQELWGLLSQDPQEAGQGHEPGLTPAQCRVLGDAQLALTAELGQLLDGGQRACVREAGIYLGWLKPGALTPPVPIELLPEGK